MNLKDVLTVEEQEGLAEAIRDNRQAFKSLLKVVNRLVADRADALVKEIDHSKLSQLKSEHTGADKVARELSSVIDKIK